MITPMIQLKLTNTAVPIRRPRDKKKIFLHVSPGTETIIQKGWLESGLAAKTEDYRVSVKQAMLIASTHQDIDDLSILRIDPQTGTWRTPEVVVKKRRELDRRLQQVESGEGTVARRSLVPKENLARQKKNCIKHVLRKKSARCGMSRSRWFDISDGRLRVYKSDSYNARVRKSYELRDARCEYEWAHSHHLHTREKFMPGKEARLCLVCPERPQGPLYLYPDESDPAEAIRHVRRWESACKMAKYLQSPADKEALSAVVRLVTGATMAKAWHSLFDYSREMLSLKETIKRFGLRLMKIDISRGWYKARLIYLKRKRSVELRQHQQEFAAKFLASRMQVINSQNARPYAAVRKNMMTTIQKKFRHYRQEKIFDRVYSLGSQANSRIHQAKMGTIMDLAFTSLDCEDTLQMTLTGEGEKFLRTDPAALKTKKSTYSETTLGLQRAQIHVSDSLAMLSFVEMEESQDTVVTQLAESQWASFINLDQVSSVTIHAARQMAKNRRNEKHHELHPDMVQGIWFTLNGPRVCWNRRVHRYPDPQLPRVELRDTLGAADGFEVPRKLANSAPCKMLSVQVGVRSCSIPKVKALKFENKETGGTGDKKDKIVDDPLDASLETYMILNLLGRQFRTESQTGEYPKYTGSFTMEVPVASDDAALSSLDHVQVAVDIMEVAAKGLGGDQCIWAGKMPLWKVFAPSAPSAALLEGVQHLKGRLDSMRNGEAAVVDEDAAEGLIPLSKTLEGGNGSAIKKIRLYHAFDEPGEQWASGYVQFEFRALIKDSRDKRCISPDLQGCGLTTCLYSTHRGAWYNPKTGRARFVPENVPSYVELKLKSLTFPEKDPVDAKQLFQYFIQAKLNGTAVCTKPLTRARSTWSQFIRVSDDKLDFAGKRLYIPIPPGAYCNSIPKVELFVFRIAVKELPTLTFRGLLASNGSSRSSGPPAEKVYHCHVSLDGMFLDADRSTGNTIILSKVPAQASQALPGLGIWGEVTDDMGCVLDCIMVLRDRDFVRMSMTEKGEEKMALCIGDNAMLVCEAPMRYPKTEVEFRHRALPDDYNPAIAQLPPPWKAKLRDPSMSHEWSLSGLDKLETPPIFRQMYIPAGADDVIPYKFVLPESERDFQQAGFPGVFHRVMDTLVETKGDLKAKVEWEPSQSSRKPEKHIVEYLTHSVKSIPVTILAVYANGERPATCDVEVSAAFVYDWESKPDREYSLPGSVLIKEFQDASDAHVRGAPVGTGDVGQRQRRRVVLKDVPIASLSAVHAASFNIYDARFATTEEAMTVPPSSIKNDFNPRASSEPSQVLGSSTDRRGGYSITAGPLPGDAGASAAYEWQLSLRASSEADMHHFLTMLRQCARMDFYQQSLKMHEFKQRNIKTGNVRYQVGSASSQHSGHLEVVLVEAKRLKATRVQKHKDAKEMLTKAVTPELNPYVICKWKNVGEPHPWDPAKHAPIRNGEIVRVVIDGWQGRNPSGEDFCVDLLDASGNVALHWAVIFAERRVRRNAYSTTDGSSSWGAEESAGGLPQDIRPGVQITIEFEKSPSCWEVTINGVRSASLDFAHRSAPPPNVSDIKVSETCVHPKVYILQREELVVKGSKQQSSPAIHGTSNPNWSLFEDLHAGGGWVFKSPPMDPAQMPKLVFELSLMNHQVAAWLHGMVRVPVTGHVAGEGGIASMNLCDERAPFHNLWLPLSMPNESGILVPKPSGEVHVMTRWVVNHHSVQSAKLPKSARAIFLQQLRPKLLSSSLREPPYELNMRCTYNPNLAKDVEFPLTQGELISQHAEELFSTVPYLACCESRSTAAWSHYVATLENHANLADIRNGFLKNSQNDAAYDLDELLRRGIPPTWRLGKDFGIWNNVTRASQLQERLAPTDSLLQYLSLLEHSNKFKSDAVLQLQEDMVTAASWESSAHPTVVDTHLHRLKRARNVCAALITFSYKFAGETPIVAVEVPGSAPSGKRPQTKVPNVDMKELKDLGSELKIEACGVAYCESLLVLAFFMLLPQVGDTKEANMMRQVTNDLRNAGSKLTKSTSHLHAQLGVVQHGKEPNALAVDAEEEARAFWLLYSLIGSPLNQAFKDYYGAPQDKNGSPLIADHRGASEDVFHLNSCVSMYDRDLWIHMTALGFNLSTVFHGAFMRLFAFYMPTATVYRFWDLLFTETTRVDPKDVAKKVNKPQRHALIDLAYGSLTACRSTLLKCVSEREFRDCIIGFLEAMYDSSTMMEITTEAERALWEAPHTKHLGVLPEHIRDFEMNMYCYTKFMMQFMQQNEVLADLTRDVMIPIEGRSRQLQQPGGVHVGNQAQFDTRLTVKNVFNHIIGPLRDLFVAVGEDEIRSSRPEGEEGEEELVHAHDDFKKFGGMFRKTSDRLCELGPEIDSSAFGTVRHTLWTLFGRQADRLNMQHADECRPIAHSMPVLPKTIGEPTNLSRDKWVMQITRAMGEEWNKHNCVERIYDAFESPEELRMSLNEFFISLICCCKGTVGEKALALFHLYAHTATPYRLNHKIPVLHHTKCIVEKVEGSEEREKGAAAFAPPNDEEIPHTTALHFKIHTHNQGESEPSVLGEVFVPSLHPFIWAGMGKDAPQPFTIWGAKMQLPPGVQRSQGMRDDPSSIRPFLGEMNIGVKWMPCANPETPEKGQIGIHVHSIRFDVNRVEAPKWKNPSVEVFTYDDRLLPRYIKRWDPRNDLRHAANAATFGLAYSGAYSEHIEFPTTMRRDPLGLLHHKVGSGNHGWQPETGLWVWNEKWGDQYSDKDFVFRKDLLGLQNELKPNTIPIQACRLLTLSILRRSLCFITNRQAMLVADSVFNRAGAVPGIIDAVLVQGSSPNDDFKSPTELKAAYDTAGRRYVCVKRQLIIELEKQANMNMGNINLWDPAYDDGGKKSLSNLGIPDAFPFSEKLLWIRYCRAGDGERSQMQIKVDRSGYFTPECCKMEMDLDDSLTSQAQMNLSKEEFVSCILANPMISESLRQLSSSDCSTENLPKWQPIKLDVVISDPAHHTEDDDIFDVLNVRQSILLEVWDKDLASKDDFLGEAWLPPLGTLGRNRRQFVLPVRDASRGIGGTRPDPKKKLDDHSQCTGDLTIQASFTLPYETPKEAVTEESLEERVKREEMLHTGELFLKIVKAVGVRNADLGRTHGSDPYVVAYVRNECYDEHNPKEKELMWRKNPVTGLLDPLFKTSVKKATLNPEWNEETTVRLHTGAFEKRTKQHWHLHVTKRGKQEQIDKANLDIIKDQDELRICFGDDDKKMIGARHGVQVYLGDTIREFKAKVVQACHKEAMFCESSHDAKQKDMAAKYKLVTMSFRHAVTVFEPSERLRSLAQQQRTHANEYKRLYRLEESDPSSWQPLDPISTFNHYQTLFGFGLQQQQRLRISEGTEDYKLRNHRYRKFEDARIAASFRLEDRNTEAQCYGYGLYSHAQDGDSKEWRALLADRPESQDTTSRNFKVHWLYTPKLSSASAAEQAAGLSDNIEILEESAVLLAPQSAKILGSGSFEHLEFLAQAAELSKQGKPIPDIAKILNERLMAKFEISNALPDSAPAGDGSADAAGAEEQRKKQAAKPPPITQAEIRHHLAVLQTEIGGSLGSPAAPGQSSPAPQSSSAMSPAGRPARKSARSPAQAAVKYHPSEWADAPGDSQTPAERPPAPPAAVKYEPPIGAGVGF